MEKGNLVYRVTTPRGFSDLTLTFCTVDDFEIQRHSITKLRQYRLLRMILESRRQGNPLGYKDLSMLLLVSSSTLKRDLQELRGMGLDVQIGRRGQRES